MLEEVVTSLRLGKPDIYTFQTYSVAPNYHTKKLKEICYASILYYPFTLPRLCKIYAQFVRPNYECYLHQRIQNEEALRQL